MKKTYVNTKIEGKLKDTILLHFNYNVKTTNDAIRLSESIFKKTKKNINYNTLRRFFNTVPTNSKPSLFTLNTLAEYVGYKNWELFCNGDFVNESLAMLDFEIISNIRTKIDFNNLIKLTNEFTELDEFHGFLRNIISIAFNKKDYTFFTRIFELKKAFIFNDKTHIQIYYTINLLGSYVSQDKELQQIAIKNYYKLPFTINFYVEYYVDLDNINGYYGLLLDKYIKNKQKDKQAILFYNCMKFYGCYLTNSNKNYARYLNQINTVENYNSIYSIPIARKRVCQAIYSLHKTNELPINYKESIIKDLKLIGSRIDFIVQTVEYIAHLSQGLFWCKEYELIKHLVEEYLFVKKLEITHIANSRWNHLKVYYSVSLFYSGNKILAKEYLKSVNELSFEAKQYQTILKDYKLAKSIVLI